MDMGKISQKVLFVVDHKHRDLPSLSLIGFYLEKLGYAVKYVALWEEHNAIKQFRPQYIVLPKPHYDNARLLDFKRRGIKTIIILTEGNNQNIDHKYNIVVPPDMMFFWNEYEKSKYDHELSARGTTMKVTGYPRNDFIHERYSGIFPSRRDLLVRYGLPSENKTITLATSIPDAHFTPEERALKSREGRALLKEAYDYRLVCDNMDRLKDLTLKVIDLILTEFKEMNLIIKPHPNESIHFWKEIVESHPKSNICLLVGEPINHLLKVSDLHVTHNVCTTTIESLLAGIPVVEMQNEISARLYKEDHLNIASFKVRTYQEVRDVITRVFVDDEPVDIFNSHVSEYIAKYFHKHDGLRCYEYALEMSRFMEEGTESDFSVHKLLIRNSNLRKGYVRYLKNKLGLSAKNLIKDLIFYDRWKMEKGKILIDGRGRFDNRIKPGDENIWFERFEKMDLDVGVLMDEYRQTVTADEIKKK
jgi:surface carbohydrate biosynthesis protein